MGALARGASGRIVNQAKWSLGVAPVDTFPQTCRSLQSITTRVFLCATALAKCPRKEHERAPRGNKRRGLQRVYGDTRDERLHDEFTPQKVSTQSFCQSQFPHKSADHFFELVKYRIS